jgi:di/tricarboxylate transporter
MMMPVILRVARNAGISPSRLLIPLSFASLLGGLLTIIGTPPNLVVNGVLLEAGLEEFGFFSFAPMGLVLVAAGIGYMALFGRRLLPGGPVDDQGAAATRFPRVAMHDLKQEYQVAGRMLSVRVEAGSSLSAMTVGGADLQARFSTSILRMVRPDGSLSSASEIEKDDRMPAGTVLTLIAATPDDLSRLIAETGVVVEERDPAFTGFQPGRGAAEIMPTSRSRLLGNSLKDIGFRERYGLWVIAMRRGDDLVTENLAEIPLRIGDTLVVQGPLDRIRGLKQRRSDFILVSLPEELEVEEVNEAAGRAPWAIGILLAMLVLMTAGLVPHVVAVLLAALAMVLTGCVRLPRAYGAVNWESLVLIAGMLPAATALRKTGGLDLIVDALLEVVTYMGPTGVLAVIFIVTSFMSLVMSNTVTTVLIAPVALYAALELEASPHAFLMVVAVAASTAFSTPMATPPNTLVLGAGHYRFVDYLKVGLPLQVILFILTLLVVPLLY